MPVLNVILGLTHLLTGLLLVGLSLPMIRRRVPMNALYGVRFKKAFESEATWYAVNEYGGRRLLAWGVVIGVIGLAGFLLPFQDRPVLTLAYAFLPLLILIPCWQTYRYLQTL